MPIAQSADRILFQVLSDQYRGKTILDDMGVPLKVAYVHVYDDSPDPGWMVGFDGEGYPPLIRSRRVGLGEPLPEIWPYEVPVSPAS